MTRLLAFDLDGTLLDDSKHIPAAAADLLRRAVRQGLVVAFCSGRNHADALHLAGLTGIPVWSITTNGAYLGHSTDAHALRVQPLPAEKAVRIIALSREFHAAPCIYTPLAEYNDAGYAHIAQKAAKKGQHTLINPTKPESMVREVQEWKEILSREEGNIMKCIAFQPNADEFPAFRAALEAEGGLTVTTSIMLGGFITCVEINREGVSKGNTLSVLQSHLHISSAETLVFGDSDNDLSMLPNGRFVAMGNAQEHVRQQAWAVTGINNDNGIAQALEQYVFCADR